MYRPIKRLLRERNTAVSRSQLSGPLGALLSSPALGVRSPTALQVLQDILLPQVLQVLTQVSGISPPPPREELAALGVGRLSRWWVPAGRASLGRPLRSAAAKPGPGSCPTCLAPIRPNTTSLVGVGRGRRRNARRGTRSVGAGCKRRSPRGSP